MVLGMVFIVIVNKVYLNMLKYYQVINEVKICVKEVLVFVDGKVMDIIMVLKNIWVFYSFLEQIEWVKMFVVGEGVMMINWNELRDWLLNVVGLLVCDVVYLIEDLGMYVNFYGYGIVVL